MSFVHLHLHSEYSLLDGACRIKDIPNAVKTLGQNAVAITDHGVMYGCVDFYRECKKEGIKPIIGCEIYVCNDRFDKEKKADGNYTHLILLCKNEIGYRNLIQIESIAFTEGFYIKPRVDLEILKRHNEGIIALSACLGGQIPKFILDDNLDSACEYALTLNNIFGQENFYLELQSHGINGQNKVNTALLSISKKTGIPLVATNDVHYLNKKDAVTQAVLMCIQTNSLIGDGRSKGFDTDEFYLKSEEEMNKLFEYFPFSCENTQIIADRCNYDFDFSKLYLPAFVPPEDISTVDYLKKLCYEGLDKRISESIAKGEKIDREIYINRLEYELSVIIGMGYTEYYLIVEDFIRYAKNQKIPTGPGRGSGAGSLCAYCLNITDVDSIKYNLLFERFLNPERVSMPDFDIDFCYIRRGEVIDYVTRKYQSDHVAQIVSFNTLAARAAIRDVGRVMGYSYTDVDSIAKKIPSELTITIDKALSSSKELLEIYETNPKLRKLINIAKSLEGMPRNTSTHPAGVVITDKPVCELVPLSTNGGVIVTQYSMNTIADLGLLKIDFLGLRYITVIDDAQKEIRKNHPDFDINLISFNDEKTYSMLSSGNSDGIFQLESSGMKNLLTRMCPRSIEDITAAISLFRPGPMDSIPKYIANRQNPNKTKYDLPILENILSVTNGCIIYQEQVMQIFVALAGYTYGRADIVRRLMSKKKVLEMKKEEKYFFCGKKDERGKTECVGTDLMGIPRDIAKKIFSDMADFAKYAFNKSHAASYAITSYRTAYLKYHYPREYMSALLTSVLDRPEKIAVYILECRRMGIKVLPPDVNESFSGFTPTKTNIRFGLMAIKNVGGSFIEKIISERVKNGNFKSLEDFIVRLSSGEVNKRMIESLIKSGAFDGFGKKRSQLLCVFESAIDSYNKKLRSNIKGQIDLFASLESGETNDDCILKIEYPEIEELSFKELLSMEKDTSGLYFSGHPLFEYSEFTKSRNAITTEDINSSFGETPTGLIKEHQIVSLVGLVTTKKIKITKNDSKMAFVNFEDTHGNIELIIFPNVFEKYGNLIVENSAICVLGEVSVKENFSNNNGESIEEGKIIVKSIMPAIPNSKFVSDSSKNILDFVQSQKVVQNLYLKVPSMESENFVKIRNLLEIFDGKCPVFVYFEDKKKLTRAVGLDVYLTANIIKVMKNILGENNVVVKNKDLK